VTLADEARGHRLRPGPVCKLQRLKVDDPGLYDELRSALDDHSIQISGIYRALIRRGIDDLSHNMLERHRNGLCAGCR
jgi:hypothetical protein